MQIQVIFLRKEKILIDLFLELEESLAQKSFVNHYVELLMPD